VAEETDVGRVAKALVERLAAAGKVVATAESCTGGWIAKALTDVAGSSAVFGYGIVSYSNDAKAKVLGVREATLAQSGAVSQETVVEMAEGVLHLSGADISVAVSGIAGPDGGSSDKPVGTVWFAWSSPAAGTTAHIACFGGDRDDVRRQTVLLALNGVDERLQG
jgi:nicotinamide-nucleotide amidase